MRKAFIVAAIVGGAILYRQRQAAKVLPAPAPEGSPSSAATFLAGSGSPDIVLGAAGGYGPLRSAWG